MTEDVGSPAAAGSPPLRSPAWSRPRANIETANTRNEAENATFGKSIAPYTRFDRLSPSPSGPLSM